MENNLKEVNGAVAGKGVQAQSVFGAEFAQNIIEALPLAKMLKSRAKSGQLSHAYLFVSPDKLFLNEFLTWFSAEILGNRVKVESGTHPDFMRICEDKSISVEQIKPIVSDVFSTPLEADNKVYVITDFSVMTAEAQNKLLKTLEEPPQKVILLLGASSDSAILQTILSRSAWFDLDSLNEKTIVDFLTSRGVDAQSASIISTCAGGNITQAIKLSENSGFFEMFNLALKMLKNVNSSRDILPFLSLIDVNKISLAEFFDLTISLLRDIMVMCSGQIALVVNRSKIEELKIISVGFNLVSLEKIIKLALACKKDLVFNANAQMVLDEFLLKMVEIKVLCKK